MSRFIDLNPQLSNAAVVTCFINFSAPLWHHLPDIANEKSGVKIAAVVVAFPRLILWKVTQPKGIFVAPCGDIEYHLFLNRSRGSLLLQDEVSAP